ncbi:MAG: ATP-binding protein [Planctomycetota bacterium]
MHSLLSTVTFALTVCSAVTAQHYRAHFYHDSDGLPRRQTYAAAQDRDGRMWFANRLGVVCYDGATWQQAGEVQRPKGHISIDDEGAVWCVDRFAELELHCLRAGTWSVHPLPADIARGRASALLATGRGRVYVGTYKHGVIARDGDVFRALPVAPGMGRQVRALAQHGDDLLVATGAALARYREADLTQPPTLTADLPGPVHGMASDDDCVWLAGEGWFGRWTPDGVATFGLPEARDPGELLHLAMTRDGAGGAVLATSFTKTFACHHVDGEGRVTAIAADAALPVRGVSSLTLDREHNVWVCGGHGVCKLTPTDIACFTSQHGLLADEVTAICRRRDGDLVLGHEGGLSLLRTGRTERIPFPPAKEHARVMDLATDDADQVWIAAAWAGLARLDAEGRVVFWTTPGLGQLHAVATRGDELWLGGQAGLFRFEAGRFTPQRFEGPLQPRCVRSLTCAPDGAIWMATVTQGVLRMDPDGALTQWTSKDGMERSTFGVTLLPEGRVLAASSAGLLELKEGGFAPATESLGREPVFFATPGVGPNELWQGTTRGVIFSRGAGVRRIDRSAGFLGRETNRHAALRHPNGELWVGSDAGLNRVSGASYRSAACRPTLELLDLGLDEHEPDELGGGRARTSLTARFRAISFFEEAKLRFYYKLEGLHDDWVGPVDRPDRVLRFSDLEPGEYRLRAFIEGADNQRSDEVAAPPVTVTPAFLDRWWALPLLGLAACLMAWRIGRCVWMARYARRLEEAVEERTRQLGAAQLELARERDQMECTLDSIGDAVVATDADGVVFHWNSAAEALTGVDAGGALGRRWSDLLPALELPESGEFRFDGVTVGGRVRTVEGCVARLRNRSRGGVAALRDVTHRTRLEQEVARRQRLESVGTLAAGIAHDFNNDLTVLRGTLDLLSEEASLDAGLLDNVAAARDTIDHSVSLTGQLLTFSSGGAPVRRPTDLAGLLEDVAERALASSDVRVHYDLDAALPDADVDPAQMRQVLHNLLVNARDHLPAGGNLTLSLREAAAATCEEPGRWLELTVSDDGPGMPVEQQQRAFDLFYSTREGQSGLGLSVVHATVTRHGGQVRLTSTPGEGTTFRLLLPAVAAAETVVEVERPAASAPADGKVLVMDDEPAVRHVLVRMLQTLGCEVVEAAKGEDAIAAYDDARAAGTPFDLVTLDLKVAGGLGGLETAEALLARDPGARLLAVSGYSDDGTLAQFEAAGFCGALAKPFQRSDLVAKLQAIGDRTPAPRS